MTAIGGFRFLLGFRFRRIVGGLLACLLRRQHRSNKTETPKDGEINSPVNGWMDRWMDDRRDKQTDGRLEETEKKGVTNNLNKELTTCV